MDIIRVIMFMVGLVLAVASTREILDCRRKITNCESEGDDYSARRYKQVEMGFWASLFFSIIAMIASMGMWSIIK